MSYEKKTRGAEAGRNMGVALVEFVDMMYNRQTAIRVMRALCRVANRGLRRFEREERQANEKDEDED